MFRFRSAAFQKILKHHAARGARTFLAHVAEYRIQQLVDDFFFRPHEFFGTQTENRIQLVAVRRAHAHGFTRQPRAQIHHFGYLHRLPRLQTECAEGREDHRAVHQLGPLRALDVVGDGNGAGMLHQLFQRGQARGDAAIEFTQPKPRVRRIGVALNQSRCKHFRRQLQHAAHHPRLADDVDDVGVVHAVLRAHDHAVFLQIRLDEFT